MIKEINSIMKWNKIANNSNFNKNLEISLLTEEFSETIIALKNKDKLEVLDWVLDVFIVWIWTLYKMWFSDENIDEAFKRIMVNNFEKFKVDENNEYKCIKDENWKIIKPKNFRKVDLSDLVPDEYPKDFRK